VDFHSDDGFVFHGSPAWRCRVDYSTQAPFARMGAGEGESSAWRGGSGAGHRV